MQEFLESILNRCLDILESDAGSILLLDKDDQNIVVRVARGENKQSILGKRVRLGEGIAGLVALKKKPLLIEDVRKEDAIKLRCRTKNYRTHSFLSVPVMRSSKLLGVINITEKTNGKPFTIKELSFVSAIANCAAETIERIAYNMNLEKQLDCFKNSTAVTKFTSAIAHELNNPLDGIMRYTHLCLVHTNDQNVIREYLIEIKSGLKRMSEIIKSMLEFSFAGDRKHIPLHRQDVEVNDILRKVVSFYQQQAFCKRIEIETQLSDELPKVKDCGLQQMFGNFVKNAFEAINEDGKLTVKSYKDNGSLCIDFIDTGKGIDENVKDKIFEPFFSTRPAGNGLGLAIVKEIISCYDGEIKLESVSQGGAKFTIVIPIGGEK